MTQITINSKTYQISEKADVFNTHIEGKKGESSIPVTYKREEIIEGVRTGDKAIIAFVQGRIEVGSPYFKEVTPTETDLENIKILEEATAEVEQLRADLKTVESDLEATEKQLEFAENLNETLKAELSKAEALKVDLSKALEVNKALEAEIKALKKAGTAKAGNTNEGGV